MIDVLEHKEEGTCEQVINIKFEKAGELKMRRIHTGFTPKIGCLCPVSHNVQEPHHVWVL